MTQISSQHCRRSRAIDVVVAQYGDGFGAHHRIGEPCRRRTHAGQRIRIRHQRAHGGIEVACDLVRLDSAAGKNPRQQLRDFMTLRDGERARLAHIVEAIAPGAPAYGILDAEKQAPLRPGRCCQDDRHRRKGITFTSNSAASA